MADTQDTTPTDHDLLCQKIVREQGMCGAFTMGGTHVCILPAGHAPEHSEGSPMIPDTQDTTREKMAGSMAGSIACTCRSVRGRLGEKGVVRDVDCPSHSDPLAGSVADSESKAPR
jgi:hypothetical protein